MTDGLSPSARGERVRVWWSAGCAMTCELEISASWKVSQLSQVAKFGGKRQRPPTLPI